ncbi:hypothetical protein GALMADRAFT_258804 [Galerina marginata CBS 339.88]|uniref:Uncharacterized protein n=1 Tax=Galerina marginata (strain CBS 339.88) TaxID=685588 RepID=A0A067SJJ5_GALM3|nr:hypothetical protein GALMADRAFT_258804 [Galerina marginata CBS 339.88]
MSTNARIRWSVRLKLEGSGAGRWLGRCIKWNAMTRMRWLGAKPDTCRAPRRSLTGTSQMGSTILARNVRTALQRQSSP